MDAVLHITQEQHAAADGHQQCGNEREASPIKSGDGTRDHEWHEKSVDHHRDAVFPQVLPVQPHQEDVDREKEDAKDPVNWLESLVEDGISDGVFEICEDERHDPRDKDLWVVHINVEDIRCQAQRHANEDGDGVSRFYPCAEETKRGDHQRDQRCKGLDDRGALEVIAVASLQVHHDQHDADRYRNEWDDGQVAPPGRYMGM